MKRFFLIMLLAGCGSQDAATGDEPAAPAAATGNSGADAGVIEARVDAAMRAVLQDVEGARYRNVRAGLAGSICGEISPRRTSGGQAGFRPFLVCPTVRVVAAVRASPSTPSDHFPDLYRRLCASDRS